MNLELFYTIQKILIEKYKMLDNVVYTKHDILMISIRQGISQIFLNKWVSSPDSDPLDILENMILLYFLYQKNAGQTNRLKLYAFYTEYIRTLISIKNLIKKETTI